MTAADEGLRAALAKALPGGWGFSDDDRDELATALLPTVRAAMDRRAAEAIREAAATVQAVYDLQCPVRPPGHYMDAGAYHAHVWWQKVLGGKLRDLRARAAELAGEDGQ